jgi:putative CocE/NonD family hydrolase
MSISRRDVLLRGAALLSAAPAMIRGTAEGADRGGWRLPDKNSVQVIDNAWIGLKDGTQLSARLWLPEHAGETRVPVVWEYIPYRKRDLYRSYDDLWGQELAQYGIAFARVDARGSGDSQGILVDEYLDRELNDGVEVIAWLARQPWSNGSVGMRGISWGGINTLQIAALAPPEWQCRPILPSWATLGASNGVSASTRRRLFWSSGCRTRPTTPTGSAARCPPTTGASNVPCTSSTAGSIPTSTPSPASSRSSPCRAKR